MTDVVGQLRANKMKDAPSDPATDAARRNVAAAEESRASLAELIALSEQVRQGDRRAQERIVWILDNHPALADWIGDLSQRAEMTLIDAVSGDVFAFKLARARRADSMRQELLATCRTPLEKMAARNIVAAWLQVQVIDENFASAAQRGVPLQAWSKMQERAAKRYQNALKSLELAAKASQVLNRSNSAAAADAAPIAATPTKAPTGEVKTRSKPAKRKPVVTVAEMPPAECVEQTNCDTPVRPPTGPTPTSRRPAANRLTQFVGANGAPPSSNGHTNHEPPITVGASNGK
jgi:hypothetical protein